MDSEKSSNWVKLKSLVTSIETLSKQPDNIDSELFLLTYNTTMDINSEHLFDLVIESRLMEMTREERRGKSTGGFVPVDQNMTVVLFSDLVSRYATEEEETQVIAILLPKFPVQEKSILSSSEKHAWIL
ncbi:hypothetical protein IV203_037044 [Nitzschia inconspicua]|uniref:Uncharacterized protein n=1 Tax=Nitzschia inconspicua TaxID=303405 RepID=A0A9K3LLD4_9STRA|nr:hypothetical protein IV203_037044 [Nitzschia inconspicua]